MEGTTTETSNLQEFEELVTCSIHLGILHDARLLPCGHTFCRTCIDDYLQSRSPDEGDILSCPDCRQICNLPTPYQGIKTSAAYALPRAIADNQLVELIEKKTGNLCPSSTSSVELHEEVNHNELPAFTRQLHIPGIPFHASAISELNSISADSNSIISSSENDFVRARMQKFKHYKVTQRISVIPTRPTLLSNAFCSSQNYSTNFNSMSLKVSCADVIIDNQEMYILMINDYDHTLVVRSSPEYSLLPVPIVVNSFDFHPVYLKVHENRIYMTGIIQGPEPDGVLIECRLDGKLVRKSSRYPVTNANVIPVCGFSIDSQTGNILLALPSDERIVELSSTLEETGVSHSFVGFQPSYLIKKSNTSEIWVSCPNNGRLLVLDELTGRFSQIGTEKIYRAVPSHLIFTSDQRIMFLDSAQSRVFWIQKENDYILVQSVIIDDKRKRLNISCIAPLKNDHILFTFRDKVLFAKPKKPMNNSGASEKCLLL